jgi:hypothetical protein
MKKKKFKSNNFELVILALSLALILTGCGGGGGGGGQAQSILNSDNAPQVAGSVLQAAAAAGRTTELGETETLSVSSVTLSKPLLRRILNRAMSISKTEISQAELLAQGSLPSTTENCAGGGTVTLSATWTDNPQDPSNVINLQMTMTFNSCREGTETLNGAMTIAYSGSLLNPTTLTISASNLSLVDTATGDNITMTNYSMVFSDLVFSGDELTGGTITMTGTISGTVGNDPIYQEYDNFKNVFMEDATGASISISGRVRVSCLGDWITITTHTPIFMPAGASCPTEGDISVTSGGNSVQVVIESDLTVTVYYNDTLVQSYSDCEEVDGLCPS